MRKKPKRKPSAPRPEENEPEASAPPPSPGIATAFGPLLERAGLNKLKNEPSPRTLPPPGPKPRSLVPEPSGRAPRDPIGRLSPLPAPSAERPLTVSERSALNAAYRGVQPIHRSKRARATPPAPFASGAGAPSDTDDRAARARLSALVAGGVRFEVRWDDGLVEGLRKGSSEKFLRRLSGAGFEPEAKLDLHGLRRAQAERVVHDFVRTEHRRGVRYVLIIVGKGSHSDDGVGVLAEATVQALTQGVAAPLVCAFATADVRHGGRGAVAVQLG